MANVWTSGIREKLANVRELYPGMSEQFYRLAEWMSKNTDEQLNLDEILLLSICVCDDLENGRTVYSWDFPKKLAKTRKGIETEIDWIPQLMEAVEDETFASMLRKDWDTFFSTSSLYKFDTKSVDPFVRFSFYDSVRAATDWWAKAIIFPNLDIWEPISVLRSLLNVKKYSWYEIRTFKETLGWYIERKNGFPCEITVDRYPCEILAKAGKEIGVDELTGYPQGVTMIVEDKRVIVRGYPGAPDITIWEY